MKAQLLLSLVAISISGCAGLDITPISAVEEAAAHAGGNTRVKGYVIYQPMVVVEVTQKEVCKDKDEKGNCKGEPEVVCSAGTPFTLPDPARPFLLDARSGFGKTGVEVSITNGWQLGSIKDNSDNTAILGTLEKALGLKAANAPTGKASPEKCKASGLYRVTVRPKDITTKIVPATAELDTLEVELTPLLVY